MIGVCQDQSDSAAKRKRLSQLDRVRILEFVDRQVWR